MEKKIYNIIGFDCVACAAKAESHLNTKDGINSARIDFASNKLYLNFNDKALPIEDIKRIIKEVESDEIEITEIKGGNKNVVSFFNKRNVIMLIRIIISLVLILCAKFIVFKTLVFEGSELYIASVVFFFISYIILGYDIFYKIFNKIFHKQNPVDEYFLILISLIGVIVLTFVSKGEENELFEGAMVILLFDVGRLVESFAITRSKNAITGSIDSRKNDVTILIEGREKIIQSEDIKIGQNILIKSGETIPVDGVCIEGEGTLDQSSLNGEFTPIYFKSGDAIMSGTILKTGTLVFRAEKEYKDSMVSKILDLITKSGEKKSKADHFITKFAKIYTPVIIGVALLFFVIYGPITKDWYGAVLKSLAVLIIACPCSIVISIPLGYFAGLGLASKNGIIFKGTNYLEEFSEIKKLISDKTGTLTRGSFQIAKVKTADGISENDFMDYLYAVESFSNHPIAKTICHGIQVNKYTKQVKSYKELIGEGVTCTYNNKSVFAGNDKYFSKNNIKIFQAGEIGTIVHLAVNKTYYGYIVLSDEIKEDAQPMVDLVHSKGVEIILLTGDKEDIAKETCKKLGIDRYHANLLPENKIEYLDKEMENVDGKVAFIGDGINDAPAILKSDIGIAMGAMGSDVAINNSDVIIVNDDPAKVYEGMEISRVTKRRCKFIVLLSILVKVTVMILDFLPYDIISKHMFIAVLADTGLTVLSVILALLILYKKIRRPKLKNTI